MGAGVGAGVGAAVGSAATGSAAAGWAAAPDSMNARMSFFVTRPPVPLPGTRLGSTPCSAAILATTGETNVLPFSLSRRLRLRADGPHGGDLFGHGFGGHRFCRRHKAGLGGGWWSAAVMGGGAAPAAPITPARCRRRPSRLPRRGSEDDALTGARHLGVDLVRGDLEQRLVQRDRLPPPVSAIWSRSPRRRTRPSGALRPRSAFR